MIKFNQPYITGNEIKYLLDVIERKNFYGGGYYTALCQSEINKILGSEKVLLTDSCTSALEVIALLLRDWSLEQEVILPSYTFTSTAAAFARVGFKLKFCEIDPKTLMIDIQNVEKLITKNTVALVGVHYAGNSFDVLNAKELCEYHKIRLIEDAAQAFGCILNDKALGLYGDFAAFSFHETKNLHCGLGGALVINDEEFYDRATFIAERGTNRQEVLKGLVDKYSWVEIGGSHYPTELQAAFLYAQLENFKSNLEYRRMIYERYDKMLRKSNLDNINYTRHLLTLQSNYHAFWVTFSSSDECDFVKSYLNSIDINVFIGYVPLHSSKVGRSMGYTKEDLPVTENCAQLVLRLPFHNELSIDQVDYIAKKLLEAIIEYRK